ncbi:tetratricopeptide repeat protein [Roseivirga sp. UBA838]|uniref:tetratricopeptide repeat protein n=1 Tax=Roseivirga sp. UBA838 TaxID=1947393 RepID=UPI00257C1EB3|nr:tetratricopeptide repeat protein [Roseivirga sp. UBA838]
MIKRILFTFLLILISGLLQAQNIKQLFDEGKSYFDKEQYALAISKFQALSGMDSDNDMVRYASFYYAISAYKTGDRATAKNLFRQIQSKYPSWGVDEDLNYWLGVIAVEEGKVADAFRHLNQVSAEELAPSVTALKEKALVHISGVDSLKSLLTEFNDDKIASRLADVMLDLPVVEQDMDLLEALQQNYNLELSLSLEGIAFSPKKEVYNIGLFLPFAYRNDSLRRVQLETNWTTRMYHGALLGVKKLEEEGIKVNLITIDTRDANRTLESMINSGQLDSLDLILGPVTQSAVETMTRFSREKKINMVNPLSSNGEILIENPYAFLYYPSNKSIAIRSAEYAKKHFNKKKGVAVFYSGQADYERAKLYKELIEKDSFNVTIFMRVPADQSVKIQQLLIAETEVDKDSAKVARMFAEMDSLRAAGDPNWEKYTERDFVRDTLRILPDSLGHVYIASDFSSLSTSALSGIAARPDAIQFLSSSRFLAAEQSLSFGQLERLNTVFVGSNFIDYSSANVAEFRRNYINTFRASPVKEERLGDAYLGYDLVVTYGKLLSEYGKYFQVGLRRREEVPGTLTEKLNYRLTNDNRYMPYLRVKDARVVKLQDQ